MRRLELDDPEMLMMLRDLQTFLATGTLYRAGGIEDQPARWMSCISTMALESQRCDLLDEQDRRGTS